MKFSTRVDIEAPIDAVFEMLCDFEAFERSAMRRGAEVQRVDGLTAPAVGMGWDASFDLRGKRRQMHVEVVTLDRPKELVLESASQGLVGLMSFDLMPLSRSGTRVAVAAEVKPINLTARLLIQSMKLAKATLAKKFKLRVTEHAKSLEERYQRRA
jgi:uncharacterized protein YndB with AHSA1/START domain